MRVKIRLEFEIPMWQTDCKQLTVTVNADMGNICHYSTGMWHLLKFKISVYNAWLGSISDDVGCMRAAFPLGLLTKGLGGCVPQIRLLLLLDLVATNYQFWALFDAKGLSWIAKKCVVMLTSGRQHTLHCLRQLVYKRCTIAPLCIITMYIRDSWHFPTFHKSNKLWLDTRALFTTNLVYKFCLHFFRSFAS